MQLGLVGLGKMGANMARRLRQDGHQVVTYDINPDSGRDAASLAELVQGLTTPRAVWVMVPAGEPTRSAVTDLVDLLAAGDVIVDGGNSRYTEDQQHAAMAASRQEESVAAKVIAALRNQFGGHPIGTEGSTDSVATA